LTGIGAQYIEAPSQEVRHEIRSREINQTSNVENPDACTNHQHSPLSSVLRLYLRAEEGTLEGKEVAIQAGMVVTLVATEDIMEVIPATRVDGLQAAQRRGAIS
jgi:hypothetical protein